MSPKAKQARKTESAGSGGVEHVPPRRLGDPDSWVGPRAFLIGVVLLVAYHAAVMAQDINRPFCGLHSWAAASGAWAARVHVKYGWDYTGGVTTWAVGEPPPENPGRYLDHPQLAVNLKAVFFLLTGPSEWANRLYGIIWSVAGLVAILAVFHGLLGRTRALLAGAFMVLFPITGYFGTGGPLTALAFLAIYCYLAIIRGMPHGPPPKYRHWLGLVAGLFLMLQWHWGGVFYALAMGLHYVGTRVREAYGHRNILTVLVGLWVLGPVLLFAHGTSYWWFVYPISFGVGTAWLGLRDMKHKWLPIVPMVPLWLAGLVLFILNHWFAYEWWWSLFPTGLLAGWLVTFGGMRRRALPATIVLAPVASLVTNLVILLSGYNWNVSKLINLYKWRSAKGEMAEFRWSAWFYRLGEYGVTNFTVSALLVGCGFFVVGLVFLAIRLQLRRSASVPAKSEKASENGSAPARMARFADRFAMFPAWTLLLAPALLQLFVLRGALWMHQSWERPLAPVLAICCAMGLLLFRRIGATASQRYPNVAGGAFATALGVFLAWSCWAGTQHYYAIRWQHPQKIEAMKWLNENIPADKPLLSVESFMTNQHSSKGAFLRPEVAWYLDRRVVQPISPEEILKVLQRHEDVPARQRWQQVARVIVKSVREAHEETGAPVFLMPASVRAYVRQEGQVRAANLPLAYVAEAIAAELPLAKVYEGKSGQRGNSKPFRAGMNTYIIYDCRGPDQATQPGPER